MIKANGGKEKRVQIAQHVALRRTKYMVRTEMSTEMTKSFPLSTLLIQISNVAERT